MNFPADVEVLTLLVSFSTDRFPSMRATRPSELRFEVLDPLRRELEHEISQNDCGTDSALEALAILLSVRLERLSREGPSPEVPAWIREALTFIDRSFRQKIGLSDVAVQVGVHPSTLAAGFRRWMRRSVGDEIRQRRVAEAMRRLVETTEPLALIALDSGFCDQFHLTRSTLAACGLTPMEIGRRAH